MTFKRILGLVVKLNGRRYRLFLKRSCISYERNIYVVLIISTRFLGLRLREDVVIYD